MASLHIAPEFEGLGHSGDAGGVIIDDVPFALSLVKDFNSFTVVFNVHSFNNVVVHSGV